MTSRQSESKRRLEHDPKIAHAVAQWLCHYHYGDWRYDPGIASHEAFLRDAERLLDHLAAVGAL